MPVASARPGLARRLAREIEGEVLFDRFSRGRYATDASIYQVMPAGVVIPRTTDDLQPVLAAANEWGVPVLMRGGGTSQSGQSVNDALVVDCSRHLGRLLELDLASQRALVEPGIVLDELNRLLRPHRLWFPVDVSTASRATIGGMAGNNSCGARSLRYGTMRDNVVAIDALLTDGTPARFGPLAQGATDGPPHGLVADLLALGEREATEIEARFPKVQRRVGGYNLDALVQNGAPINLAHLLVGSEGTLALSRAIEIKLWPLPPAKKALGVCHFPSFRAAMEAAAPLVALGPTSVELVDATMIALGREIALFRPTLEAFVRGDPAALLLVEFAEAPDENERRLATLADVMAGLGFGFGRGGGHEGGVVAITDGALQAAIAEFRTAGLNVMMSMREAGKPVSFVEDCAVPLADLADYTERLSAVFERHGTRGTWYAHASVGCLHVRPVLNLKLEKDVQAMRAIAEEAFAMVREYKGSHSGEHGDGIVRSEFHAAMFGERLAGAFKAVKQRLDPKGLLNPGRIVDPPRMDDRRLFRYGPGYQPQTIATALDWSAWPGAASGFLGAAEMCNNNGACRALGAGVMCPSYRVTRDERDVTRGRANTLRLALTGQLGAGALFGDDMAETLRLCVSCKACRRECPTGVDMARMKIEVLHQRARVRGIPWRDRLIAGLPRYAPYAAKVGGLLALRERLPGMAALTERLTGLSRRRSLPRFRRDWFRDAEGDRMAAAAGADVLLLVDCFGRWLEPDIPRAAVRVLQAGGYASATARLAADGRPLCCGRTWLAVGAVEQARIEARRLLAALEPLIQSGRPVIGLEPACLLTLRDELPALLPGEASRQLAGQALLLEEFLAREAQAGRLALPLAPRPGRAMLHGHCHQKAFGAMAAVEASLKLVPELEVETIRSSCCGMAGAFGYAAETIDVSLAMGELALLPAVRRAEAGTRIVADGTSCRHQIADGTGRRALHVAEVLAEALEAGR
jgi:FAD/FMN-containing dehydrogenase/Fe-S oxidoreductase